MRGTSAINGRALGGEAHLRQSIADILTTPLGSRVMRRDYGSLVPELLDQPFNNATRVQLYAATAEALMRWEPRIRLNRVQLSVGDEPGSFVLELEGTNTDSAPPSERVRLTIPLRSRST